LIVTANKKISFFILGWRLVEECNLTFGPHGNQTLVTNGPPNNLCGSTNIEYDLNVENVSFLHLILTIGKIPSDW
jgi:hypothetical protein